MAAAKDTYVPGDDGWISDESSFYGDDSTKAHWEDIATGPVAETRAEAYWHLAPNLPANLAAERMHRTPNDAAPSTASSSFNWPFEGNTAARQSNETPAQFVSRLPPSRATVPKHGDWLWVHNPRAPSLDLDLDLENFLTAGRALLNEHIKKHGNANENGNGTGSGKPRGKGKQEIAHRDELARALRDLALEYGCLSGKWMLFPPNDSNVDGIWRTIVEAVVDDQLGPQAKIATASNDGSVRLICIYTKSFTDLGDVRRVLNALVKLELVDPKSNFGIWYKSDAYTHLGIEGKNPYGLRNSLYGSRDMLGHTTTASRRQ